MFLLLEDVREAFCLILEIGVGVRREWYLNATKVTENELNEGKVLSAIYSNVGGY